MFDMLAYVGSRMDYRVTGGVGLLAVSTWLSVFSPPFAYICLYGDEHTIFLHHIQQGKGLDNIWLRYWIPSQ